MIDYILLRDKLMDLELHEKQLDALTALVEALENLESRIKALEEKDYG